MERERIVDFGRPLTLWMQFKQEKIIPITNVGKELLQNGKFWFLYLQFCNADKLQNKVDVVSEAELISKFQPETPNNIFIIAEQKNLQAENPFI